MEKNKKDGLSLKELNTLLKKWQTKLLLDDWKLSLEITDFKRKDFRQSGDIKVYPEKKEAVILLTREPFLDEEETIVHELIHLLLWDYDTFCEKNIIKENKFSDDKNEEYMGKLEEIVEKLTQIVTNKNS